MLTEQVILPTGAYFHTRPCVQIAGVVTGLDCSVFLFCGSRMADASQVSSLVKLGWPQTDVMTIRAEGPDAETVVERIKKKLHAVFC